MAKALMHITAKAADRIAQLLAAREKPAIGIRVRLKAKGCSGLSYALEYVDKPHPADEKIEDQGITLYIDPQAVLFLVGTEMDYAEDPLKSGFLFKNPNEKGRCGCGESFHV